MRDPIRMAARLMFVTVLALVAFASPAFAQGDPTTAEGLTISHVGVSIIIGMILPAVYGFFVRPSNPEAVKVIGGFVVAAVAALILNAVREDGSAVVSWAMVVDVALIYGPQVLAYLGIWKPLDINERTGPGVAIGSSASHSRAA